MQEDKVTEENKIDFEFYRKIFEEFIPFHKLLGFKLENIEQDASTVKIVYHKDLLGNALAGNIHGGVLVSAMDSAGGLAAMTTINMRTDKIATIDIRTDFLSPAKKDSNVMVAATVQKSGNRVVFTHIQAYPEGQPEKILAEGRAIYSVKRKEA